MIELGNKLESNYVSYMTGTVQRVLFEEETGDGYAEGYTGQYVRVRAKAAPNTFGCVRITGVEGTVAIGEPLA